MSTERIILIIEIVEDGNSATAKVRVPENAFLDATCAGEWLENALRELRKECNEKLIRYAGTKEI